MMRDFAVGKPATTVMPEKSGAKHAGVGGSGAVYKKSLEIADPDSAESRGSVAIISLVRILARQSAVAAHRKGFGQVGPAIAIVLIGTLGVGLLVYFHIHTGR